MSAKTVFISYSHKDETWKDKLLPHLRALEQAGVPLKVWQDRQIDTGAEWYPEIREAMSDAAVAILLISADFLASGFCIKEEVPFLLERQEKEGMLLVPVLVRECTWEAHRWLAARHMVPRDGKCVALHFPGDSADSVFAEVAKKIYLHFTRLAAQPESAPTIPASVQKLAQAEVAKFPVKASELPVAKISVLSADRIDLTRLPETGSALFGRDEELKLLDAAWSNDSESRTRVLAFTAHGGVGKSTLINHWLGEMKRDHFRGATRVFGWSFYSQGVREQGPASADTFVAAALKFFGDEAMAVSPASAWDKGERLARLVGAERALLVLDGMEPLQSAQQFDRGKLRDPAIESLLRGLAKNSAGLCLISTREALPDLAKKSGFAERDLEQITPQAGRALLRTARVVGTDAELESLAQRFGPHALAISLLGVYLHEQPGHGVGPAQKLEQMPGQRPVDRVLSGFEQWLGDGAERKVLHLLGLFDRPADAGCLNALRTPPAIPGLTDRVAGLGDAEWDRVLSRLEKLRLIHTRQSDSGQRFVDAHPLVREHFAEQLREKNPDVWRAAHRRLYEHLCATTTDKKPNPTLEDLQQLYQAIAHGCLGEVGDAVYHDIYLGRVARMDHTRHPTFYSVTSLGAVGSDLAAIKSILETAKRGGALVLSPLDHGILLTHEGYCLRATGRLAEATEVLRIAAGTYRKNNFPGEASSALGVCCHTLLFRGRIDEALEVARDCVNISDTPDCDADARGIARSRVAEVLVEKGLLDEARTAFAQAFQVLQPASSPFAAMESILRARSGADAYHRISGLIVRYCLLLLAEKKADEVIVWAEMWDIGSRLHPGNPESLFHRGLCNYFLGRAFLLQAQTRQPGVEPPDITLLNQVVPLLTRAANELRRSGRLHELPRALISRAEAHQLGSRSYDAKLDLDEAWEIAERGPMKLFLADIHLHRARLFFREKGYPWISPEADLAAARQLIEQCGYWRRKEELEDAEEAIKNWRQANPERKQTMKKTVVELDLKGYSDIAREIEELFSAEMVGRFDDQIQSFVNAGLKAVNEPREKVVCATTGDGAILAFDRADDAHHFAQAVHKATEQHNAQKTVPSAKRWFRIGAATGDIAIEKVGENKKIAGTTIANAVRLESAARTGEFLVDAATYEALPAELRGRYGAEEEVAGKRQEKFRARRCVMVAVESESSNEVTVQSVLDLFDRLNPRDQLHRLMILIAMPAVHRPAETLTLFQRQDRILDWSAGQKDGLKKLAAALRSLIEKQDPR